jgi:hypothetical protein
MEAKDWLKGVEKKLVIAQCTDRENVLFATHQLFGTATNWWETYYNTHVDVDSITWNKFKARFRNHYVPRGTMKYTMLVSSPGGEMRTKHICPAVSITIREVDFLLNPILLDSKGIDIILSMDWLNKYDGVIQCARNAVKLTKKDGTSVEFVAMVQSD